MPAKSSTTVATSGKVLALMSGRIAPGAFDDRALASQTFLGGFVFDVVRADGRIRRSSARPVDGELALPAVACPKQNDVARLEGMPVDLIERRPRRRIGRAVRAVVAAVSHVVGGRLTTRRDEQRQESRPSRDTHPDRPSSHGSVPR